MIMSVVVRVRTNPKISELGLREFGNKVWQLYTVFEFMTLCDIDKIQKNICPAESEQNVAR